MLILVVASAFCNRFVAFHLTSFESATYENMRLASVTQLGRYVGPVWRPFVEFGLLWRKLSACSVEPRLDVGTGLRFLELSFLEWV